MIKIQNITSGHVDNINLQSYSYEVDNTNKEFIDDDFYGMTMFVDGMKVVDKVYMYNFYFCDLFKYYDYAYRTSIQWFLKNVFGCYQSFQFQFNSGFKPPSRMFRYRDKNFWQFCTNMYQDVVKTNVGVRGVLVDGCQLSDVDMALLTSKSLKFLIDEVHLDDISSFDNISNDIDEVLDGYLNSGLYRNKMSFQQSGEIDAGIIQDAFSKYSYQCQAMIVPQTYKKYVEGNLSIDVNFSCQIDHEMVIGTITLREKNVKVYNLGELT